jgi:hypothetical protein
MLENANDIEICKGGQSSRVNARTMPVVVHMLHGGRKAVPDCIECCNISIVPGRTPLCTSFGSADDTPHIGGGPGAPLLYDTAYKCWHMGHL